MVKIRRNEKEWKRNKIKRLKASREPHTNWVGQMIPTMATGQELVGK
jgi:hypothetical protein